MFPTSEPAAERSCTVFRSRPVDNMTEADWKDEYRLLRDRFAHAGEIIAALSVPQTTIQTFKGRVGSSGDVGGSAQGVFLVDTDHGPKVLKLIHRPFDGLVDEQTSKWDGRMSDQVILQNQFTEYGKSFPVTGVLQTEEVNALLARYPEMSTMMWDDARRRGGGSPAVSGMLMDFVPDAWNPKVNGSTHVVRDPPAHAVGWDLDKQEQELRQIADIKEQLSVMSRDPQVLIAADGKCSAFDFGLELPMFRVDPKQEHFGQAWYDCPSKNVYVGIAQKIRWKVEDLRKRG